MISRLLALNVVVFAVFFLIAFFYPHKNLEYSEVEEEPPRLLYQSTHVFPFSVEDILCMAKNIYYEAASESDLGKYAVAHITVNRVHHDKWPNTVCNVVYQHAQFSWTLDKKRRNVMPPKNNASWQRSLQIAYDVLYNGTRVVMLDESYFYHANYVKPRWAAAKKVVTTIDTHIFYSFRDI